MDLDQNSVFFVTSHLDEELTPFRGIMGVVPVNLNNLDIPNDYTSQLLAESRFFLSNHLDRANAKYIGLGTPRWGERFPKWPSIIETNKLSLTLEGREFFSPQYLYSTNENVQNWIYSQDIVHPGISRLLTPIWKELNNQKNSSKCWLPMGNSYVFPREIFIEILELWREIFYRYNLASLQNLPFSYRCVMCGLISNEGIGRWKSNRHASYFLERLMALVIASRPNLTAVRLDKFGNRTKRPISSTTRGLPITARVFTAVSSKIKNSEKCDHMHFGPGK